jgi:hypothetical protein
MKVSMNHTKMDKKKGPKNNVRSGLVIGVATKKAKCATIVFSKELQSVEKMLKREDAKKWGITMQE